VRNRVPLRFHLIAGVIGVLLLASMVQPALAATEITGATWGHWTWTGQWEFISWTDGYTGYYYRDGEPDAFYTQQVQGGCVGPSSVTQTVSGSLTYYTPRDTTGPIYSVYGPSLGCTYNPWGNGMTYNSPYVHTNTSDGFKYVRIFSQWFGAGALPNYFSDSRDWNIP